MAKKQTRRDLPGKVVAARLTATEAAAFARLLELEREKADSDDQVTGSSLLRQLVREKAAASGVWG